MSGFELDQPEDSEEEEEYCEVVRIGRNNKSAEITIFYTPNQEFQVHNGYLAETKFRTIHGRACHELKIVTPHGKKVFVRRYHDDEEFVITTSGYWLSQKNVEL